MNAIIELSGAIPSYLPRQGSDHRLHDSFPFPDNMAVGVVQNTFIPQGGSESREYSQYILGARPYRTPPQSEGVVSEFLARTHVSWQESHSHIVADIEELKTAYVFRNAEAVTHFISSHRTVARVLSNAVPQLKQSFGEDVVFNLEAVSEDDQSTSVYAVAVWRGPAERAEAAIEDFDERWWLNQAPQPGLTFTYELA